ncbi:MAG: glycosyltransferase family 4 protein [Conexibacter sp.]
MRVALNLIFLVPGETGGMEVYARELLPRLAALDGVEPVAIVSRAGAEAVDALGVETLVASVDARDRKQWAWGEQRHVPRLAREVGAQLIHNLASTGPVKRAGGPPRVTTVHDLHYATAPEAHFGLRALGMRVLVPAAVRASRRVITVSQATKDDVVRLLRFPAERIDVVHLAAATARESDTAADATPEAELRERLAFGGRPVLLSMAAKRPHKNVEGLIDALAAIAPERRPLLVVPGYATEHEAALNERARTRGVADDVRFPGWLPRADVEGLWRCAVAHVFPSFAEGFGLPVLEAMARGVPSACSDRASLPEVAGDAALLFDPSDPSAIRAAIERLLADAALRERLRAAGLARAATFSWERTARETAAVYARALG